MANRTFKIENLELRQLMSGDGIDCATDNLAVIESSSAVETSSHVDIATAAYANEIGAALGQSSLSLATAPILIERAGSTVLLVTDVAPGKQMLWSIREGGDGGATIAFQLDLGDLRAERLIVDGDHLLVIGEVGLNYRVADQDSPLSAININGQIGEGASDSFAPYNEKKILAVSFTSGEIVKELSLPPGFVKHAQFVAGEALLVLDTQKLNYPSVAPPVDIPLLVNPVRNQDQNDLVFRFSWNASGVSNLTTDEIPSGQVAIGGDRLVVAIFDDPANASVPVAVPSFHLASFTITEDDIISNGQVALGSGYGIHLHLDSSLNRATIVMSENPANDLATRQRLLLIDLTTATPTIDETINIGVNSYVLSQADDYVLFYNYILGSLSLVDLGDDVTGNERVAEVELPKGLSVFPEVVRLDEERLILLAGPPPQPLLLATGSLPVQNASSATLVTLSLIDHTIKNQEIGDVNYNSGLRLIDSASGRFGFETFSYATSGAFTRKFVFGALNDDGRFVVAGRVELMAWAESLDVDPAKLTVASANRVKAYDYDDTAEPLYSVRLVDPNALPLKANDDTAEFYTIGDAKLSLNSNWDALISVLANDQIPFASQPDIRITELIDAPEGVRIVDGRYLALSADKFSEAGEFVFKYRVTDGFNESEAEVELTIKTVSAEVREKMIAAVKSQASTDLGVPVEQITVEFDIDFPFDRVPYPLPGIVAANGANVPTATLVQTPQFFARVTTTRVNAVYRVDVDGNASKVWSLQIPAEPIASFTFAIKNAAGNQVEKVEVGDTFWLEFRGDDLRAFGEGLFSAYLNLELASAGSTGELPAITFDGTVEAGTGMSIIDGENASKKITAGSIRNLGVVSSSVVAPGGDPQLLLRVRAKAMHAGTVTFRSFASQNAAEENVLFGSSEAIPENQIRREATSLKIIDAVDTSDPLDVDGDGRVVAIDALRVINFLARHGTGTIEQIEARMQPGANNSATSTTRAEISRFDVNRNGSVTALDALSVINHMSRMNRQRTASGEGPTSSDEGPQAAIANSLISSDPAVDELEQKRRANLGR